MVNNFHVSSVKGLARYVHVGHYECIYENKISVTENRANISCCIALQTLISQQNVFSVEPQLWRETKDSNFELITGKEAILSFSTYMVPLLDSSSWTIDEPVILRLEKNDYKKVPFLDNSQLYFQTCTLTNSQGKLTKFFYCFRTSKVVSFKITTKLRQEFLLSQKDARLSSRKTSWG